MRDDFGVTEGFEPRKLGVGCDQDHYHLVTSCMNMQLPQTIYGADPLPAEVIKQARLELTEEKFRAAVEAEKLRIKTHRSLWDRIFPWKITIERRAA